MQNKLFTWLILILSVILVPVCFVFFFRFLKRYWPVPKHCYELKPIFKELDTTYRKWDLAGGVFFVFFGFAGGYFSWLLCRTLCAWRVSSLVGEHLLFPKHGICLLPAVPGAIVAGGACTLILYKVLLKSKFTEFACYGSLKLGVNSIKLIISFLFIVFSCWFLASLLTINTYMVMSNENVQYSSLTEIGNKTYQYSDIESISLTKDIKSQFKTEMYIKIQFYDGNIWKSADTEELSNIRAKNIADYLAKKTNLTINHNTIERSKTP